MNLIKITKEDLEFSLKVQAENWKLFVWMFFYSLIPAIWILVRAIVITRYMSASVSTYAQWDYLNIMLEVVQETIIFPLFWWFGKIQIQKTEHLNKVREVYLITFSIYLLLIFLLSFFVGDLVNVLGSDEGYKEKTFFILQLWSKIPGILTSVSTVILLNLKIHKGFLLLLIAKLSLVILFDFTLANNQVFDNAYIGLGVSSLLTEILIFIVSLLLVAHAFEMKKFFNLSNFSFNFKNWNFTKMFWSNVLASFLFSIINNTFYLFMMVKNMNIVSGSDAYWMANTVIWSWVLMIANIIFQINKSVVSTTENLNYKKRFMLIIEFQLMGLISLLVMFAIFIPVYKPFVMFLSNNNEELVEKSWAIFSNLIAFFIFFVLATSINAHFNGEGKNWLLTIQALICNVLTFTPFLIMNLSGKLNYDVEILALMFGFSLMVSWIVSTIFISNYLLSERKKYILSLNKLN